MAFWDLFKNMKRSPQERAVHRLLSRDTPHEDRMACIETLANEPDDEALTALLRRFDFNGDKAREDRAEKDYIEEILVAQGPRVIPKVHTFLVESNRVALPARILQRIAGNAELVGAVLSALERERERNAFKVDKSLQLLRCLEGIKDERIAPAVVASLTDFDESVRYDAARILIDQADESAREALVVAWLRPEEESQRFRNSLLEGLIALEWSVAEHREAAEKALPKDYWVGEDGVIRAPKQPPKAD